ncbi:MAG: hypothetical protein KJ600_01990 [Nanoarchaeota archaeon]|nr:hypothetical protein [Nanoarchaeota archaeon]MBU1103307.1 hypothetical protein [Nanoarchaeota archaeon]
MVKKKILAIDLVLLVGTAAAVFGMFWYLTYSQVAFSPVGDVDKVLFDFSKDSELFISSDRIFTSLEKINLENGLVIPLEEGNYYLKIQTGTVSKIMKFDILEDVKLKVVDFGESYGIVNAEDVLLNVQVNDPDGNYVKSVLLGGGND